MNTKSLFFSLVIFIATPVVCAAGSWHVEQNGSGDFTTLQPAVDAAASGDTIYIGPGWYQDYERVQLGVNWYRIMVFWDDVRDLVFIGSGVGVTTWGPSVYDEPAPFLERFRGIDSHNSAARVVVSGISFVNLHGGVTSLGEAVVRDCSFATGEVGIVLTSGSNTVEMCSFQDYVVGVFSESCSSVVVSDCTFHDAEPYFSNTVQGIVRNCTAPKGILAHFYHSNGAVSYCSATPDQYWAGVIVSLASVVSIHDNHITGGKYSLLISGQNTTVTAYNNVLDRPNVYNVWVQDNASLIAYGNDIFRGIGSAFMVKTSNYSLGNTAVVDMSNNHWGDQSDPDVLSWRIYDSGEDPDIHMTVDFMPIEGAPVPTESVNWGSVKALFRN